MNPFHWKREHQIAFFAAVVFGAGMGVFIGLRQAGSDWQQIASWGAGGAVLAGAGAFIRQVIRDRSAK